MKCNDEIPDLLVSHMLKESLDDLSFYESKENFTDNLMSEIEHLENETPLYSSEAISFASIEKASSKGALAFPWKLVVCCLSVALCLVLYFVWPFINLSDSVAYSFAFGAKTPHLYKARNEIRTAEDEVTSLLLGQELGTIQVHENSFVETNKSGIKFHYGKVAFNLSLRGKLFTVETDIGSITVNGTAFQAEFNNDILIVTVDEGVVSFNNQGDIIEIPSGKYMKVTNGTSWLYEKS